MAFGQQSGPPASAKQMKYLLSLVQEAGHDSFRDARHPLGLTQRQAGGKFSTREASELIDRLLAGEVDDLDEGPPPGTTSRADRTAAGTGARTGTGTGAGTTSGSPADRAAARTRSADLRAEAAAARAKARLDDQRAELIAGVPADDLVAELERRGWTCTPPEDPPRSRTTTSRSTR